MYGISKVLLGAAFIVAATSAAMADGTQTAGIQVQASAPKTCSLGSWTGSGDGAVAGGPNAVITFTSSSLVAADGTPKSPMVTLTAPVMCNASMTMNLKNTNGAFINPAAGTVPAGFTNKFGYIVRAVLMNAAGNFISTGDIYTSVNSVTLINTTKNVPFGDAASSANIRFAFNIYQPTATKVIAGAYAESFTLTLAPTL